MEKIAIIGSHGQLGSDIKNLLENEYEITSLEHINFSVENKEQVNKVLSEIHPKFVINTAAYHNCNLCEENPQQSFLINATAVKHLADVCKKIDATLVHFSTDYVFGKDVERKSPYIESDLPGPIQVYGVSKLSGEQLLDTYCNNYFCLRVSGLYGLKGTAAKKYPNFVEMMIALGKEAEKKNEKMPSAQDQVLTFNPTIEIAKVVQKLLKTSEYGLYHATCEGFCSRLEFVKTLFELEGINTELYGVNSDFFKPKYEQPKFSALENSKLKKLGIQMPHWKDALKTYLKFREL